MGADLPDEQQIPDLLTERYADRLAQAKGVTIEHIGKTALKSDTGKRLHYRADFCL